MPPSSAKPLPAWARWTLRALGAAAIVGASWWLVLVSLAFWLLSRSKEGILAGSGKPLSQHLGSAVGGLVVFYIGYRLLARSFAKPAPAADESAAAAPEPPKPAARPSNKRWSLCNVLRWDADARRLWQFDAGKSSFPLNRETRAADGEPLPQPMIQKSWSSLWQPRLNVALLPPDQVFIRVAQFPQSSPEETRAMVELQLEKLSPIPVTQAVWTMHPLPSAPAPATLQTPGAVPMQTVAVTIAPRDDVEKFLGRLEEQGFLADRLELPVLDQLLATKIEGDGAWIYPAAEGVATALVAWWYGGVLRNLDFLVLQPGEQAAASLRDHLLQMAWGGELEGWLTHPPRWHLVADAASAQRWEPLMRAGLEQPVDIIEPLPPAELAARTGRRAAAADPQLNLLPAEFAARYQQKFVDRLWMRGLIGLLAAYCVAVLVYAVAVGFLSYNTGSVESQVRGLDQVYTNALQMKARYAVLKDRQELKFAALNCWQKTAELMPEGLTLESLSFSDGRKLTLSGTAPPQDMISANDFSGRLRKATVNSNFLFNAQLDSSDSFRSAGQNWSFGLELKRGEEP